MGDVIRSAELPLSHDLLAYYRARLDEAEREREDYIERLKDCEVPYAELHRVQWELQRREGEILELQASLSQSRLQILEERNLITQLFAEVDNLRIQEIESRKRIQDLLDLTEPSPEELLSIQNRIPERILVRQNSDREPVRRMDQDQTYLSERRTSQRALAGSCGRSIEGRSAQKNSRKGLVIRTSSTQQPKRMLRTVYLPNEKTDALLLTLEAVKEQLEDQIRMAKEQEWALVEDRRVRMEEEALRVTNDRNRISQLQERVRDLETKCLNATKDFMVLKQTSTIAQRQLKEDNERLRAENESVLHELKAAREQSDAEKAAVVEAVEARMQLTVGQLRTQLEQADLEHVQKLVDLQQTIDELKKNISHLAAENVKLKEKCKKTETRRNLETQGYSADINELKRQLRRIDSSSIASTTHTDPAFDAGELSSDINDGPVDGPTRLKAAIQKVQSKVRRNRRGR